jgi:D-arabinose 1-dehydrogenase-like Zn-dependent alcohol dehydrogenase
MKKGRAAVFVGANQSMELREYPVPLPEPGAIVIRVMMCNICGSDLHAWHGDFQMTKMGGTLPTILGHEMTGVINQLGEGVNKDSNGEPLSEGDRVIFQYFYPCKKCPNCLKGNTNICLHSNMAMLGNCETSPHFVGGFADYYYLLPNHVIFKVPENLPSEVVTGANCALAQVIYGLQKAHFSFNETIIIQGAGGLGLYTAAVAKHMGAKKVIAIDGVKERLDLIKRFGADETVDLTELQDERSRLRRVRELTDGLGADVVVEVVGKPEVVNEGLNMVALGGRYLEIGNINKGKTFELDPSRIVFGNKSIIGVSLYEPHALKMALDFLEQTVSIYPYQELFAIKFMLADINHAFEMAKKKQVLRATIVMGE